MRKLVLLVIPGILLTFLFLFIVLIFNKENGKGALQVTAVPKGAKVYINGAYLGVTPLCRCELPQMLKTGNYNIKIVPTDMGLGTYEDQIKISPNVLTVVDRTFEGNGKTSGSIITLEPIDDKKDAQLLIISFPSDIDTYLDNNLAGKTPLVLNNLTPSDHEVRLSKNGFQDKILKIRTVAGYKLEAVVTVAIGQNLTASISPTLSPSPIATKTAFLNKILILPTPTGFLRVRNSPSINGLQKGTVTPGEIYDLVSEQTGWYEIKLKDGVSGWISSDYAKKQ